MFAIAAKSPNDEESKGIMRLSPNVVVKLAPVLTESVRLKTFPENKRKKFKPEQLQQLLPGDVETGLASLLKALFKQFGNNLNAAVGQLSQETQVLLKRILDKAE